MTGFGNSINHSSKYVSNQPPKKVKIIAFYLAFYIFGYVLFALASELTKIDALTQIYRGLCLFLSVVCLLISSQRLKYCSYQSALIIFQFAYFILILKYFASGFQHESLTLEHYINNVIFFTLLPTSFFCFDINDTILYTFRKYSISFGIIIVFLVAVCWYLGLESDYRLSFEKINPISLCQYLCLLIIIYIWDKGVSLTSMIFIIICLPIIIATGSRGPIVALFAAFLGFLLFNLTFKYKIIISTVVTICVGMIIYFYNTLIIYLPILSRFNFSTDEANLSLSIRYGQYTSALQIFEDNVFFGGGLVENYMHYYPHNIILEVLMSGGVLLFIPFLFLSLVFFFHWFFLPDKNRNQNYILIMVSMVFFSYMFSSSLATMGLLYFLIIMVTRYKKCS
ncbi:O-antigen ligase family protein [Kosakonia pseudosacchari]|uniref:O-antigen ligase family protein n=1 Tax=Kosakonia pseudosacchari TaxID=1646340 RepID=UPI000A37613C|nr:O-antigen ligase family protein [Kosakonia pseudosacchari]